MRDRKKLGFEWEDDGRNVRGKERQMDRDDGWREENGRRERRAERTQTGRKIWVERKGG
jgi:hypothetical protein